MGWIANTDMASNCRLCPSTQPIFRLISKTRTSWPRSRLKAPLADFRPGEERFAGGPRQWKVEPAAMELAALIDSAGRTLRMFNVFAWWGEA
jgi:hypothetical protein